MSSNMQSSELPPRPQPTSMQDRIRKLMEKSEALRLQ